MTEMTMDILVERADGVLTIAFNRPGKKNAITAAMIDAIPSPYKPPEIEPVCCCR